MSETQAPGNREPRHGAATHPTTLDGESLLAELRYWDEVIDSERGRSKLDVLARLEEQRAWALVRLINLAGTADSADRARRGPYGHPSARDPGHRRRRAQGGLTKPQWDVSKWGF